MKHQNIIDIIKILSVRDYVIIWRKDMDSGFEIVIRDSIVKLIIGTKIINLHYFGIL